MDGGGANAGGDGRGIDAVPGYGWGMDRGPSRVYGFYIYNQRTSSLLSSIILTVWAESRTHNVATVGWSGGLNLRKWEMDDVKVIERIIADLQVQENKRTQPRRKFQDPTKPQRLVAISIYTLPHQRYSHYERGPQ